jgi:molybdate transport system substrate-binding protein
MRRWMIFTLALLTLLAGCAPAGQVAPARTLVVLAAASLMQPFNEIAALYEAEHSGVQVMFNFAGSQQLAQQIVQGAPGDVFASASQRHMDAVVAVGRVNPESPVLLGYNRLVVAYPVKNPANLAALTDLARPGLKLILAAAEVPAGQYSLDFLSKAAQDPAFLPTFREDVLANVVSYESNVKAVVTKVSLGEADAGIVYASDLGGTAGKDLGWIDIPPELNVLAAYPIAALNDSSQLELAQAFVELVRSPAGQEILMRYGFLHHSLSSAGP